MSDHMHSGTLDDRWKLREAVNAVCAESDGLFVKSLAISPARWSSVAGLLQGSELAALERLAYAEGLSPSNLKAHYVLDEDFVDGGTAFVVFALVGSAWVHVVRLKGQTAVVPVEAWLDGEVR
jgi:hypothetical protein